MHRRTFLTRALGAIAGAWAGRYADLELAAMPTDVPAVGVVRDSVLTDVFDWELRAAGGICAPPVPFYDLPAFSARPIREALPRFTASRTGVDIPQVRS